MIKKLYEFAGRFFYGYEEITYIEYYNLKNQLTK